MQTDAHNKQTMNKGLANYNLPQQSIYKIEPRAKESILCNKQTHKMYIVEDHMLVMSQLKACQMILQISETSRIVDQNMKMITLHTTLSDSYLILCSNLSACNPMSYLYPTLPIIHSFYPISYYFMQIMKLWSPTEPHDTDSI